MHSASFAEWMLSLITTPDRASSTVGDLLEDVAARGRLWFWLCIVRTAGSLLWRSFVAAPVSVILFAVLAWFGYMITAVLLWVFAWILMMTLGWGLVYFFTHHTGLELITGLLKIRIDWPAVPSPIAYWLQFFVILINAPYHVGRFTARIFPGREMVAWLTMSLLWPLLAVFVPFAATSIRVSLPVMTIVLSSALIGISRERRAILT
jgi:hypothetical protein